MEKADIKPKQTKKLSKKAQYERFVEAARKLGCDDSMEAFEHTFRKIVPAKGTTRSA
jgi:hypothetical protein